MVDAETTFCIECGVAIFPGDASTTINGVMYHSRCYDRMVRRREHEQP